MSDPRIALFGPYASRNLGDMATQLATIQNLRRRIPGAQFIGVTPEPADTLRALGIAAFPMSGLGDIAGDVNDGSLSCDSGWHNHAGSRLSAVHRVSRFARTLDMLIVSGGGQLDDFWGGPWAHPWSMFMWTALSRRHGVPVADLAIGLDQLGAPLSRFFALQALRLARVRLFRDPGSRTAMIDLGLDAPSSVCPDLVFAMDVDPTDSRPERGRFVVLSPISRKTWSHSETMTHDDYLDGLAAIGQELAAQGIAIRIVYSQTVMDVADSHRLASLLSERGCHEVTVYDSPQVADFLRNVRGAELVVASRLHGVILSLVAGCPVVAIAHLDKVSAVMRSFDLEKFCMPLRSLDRIELRRATFESLRDSSRLRRHVANESAKRRAELSGTFDVIANILSADRAKRS